MHPYMRFNRSYHYILSVIDVLSKHAWAMPFKKWKRCGNCRDNSRRWRMSEKFSDWQRKRIFLLGCAETLETEHHSLFYVFCNEGASHRTIQSYIEERYMKTIYARRKLWINILFHLVSNYNARKYRTIDMRPNALQSPNKLLTIVYKRVKIAVSARYKLDVQSGFGIHEQIQDSHW